MASRHDLQSIRALTLALQDAESERRDLYHGKSGAGFGMAGKASKGMVPDSTVERTVMHMEDKAAMLDWRIDTYRVAINKRLDDVLPVIRRINDQRYRIILVERYIACKSWGAIIKDLGYERRYTLKLHYRALVALSKASAEYQADKPGP